MSSSSPASRRSNRRSVNGTPQRRSRNSQAPPSSDPILPYADAAEEQPQSEAQQPSEDGRNQNTPRGNVRSSQDESQSQAPPTSSPLFFRSSPAGSQSQSQSQSLNVPRANGVAVSSPLRQQAGAGSSDGGQTPRAN
ncbi:MCM DNA helicase complex subunit, partial [Friedmanniomyces endolithicus]